MWIFGGLCRIHVQKPEKKWYTVLFFWYQAILMPFSTSSSSVCWDSTDLDQKKKLAWGIPRIFSANVCSPLTNKGLASPVNVQAQSHWRWRLCGHGDAMDSSHVPLGNKVLSIQIKSWKYHRNMKLIAVNQPPQSRRGNASFATLTSFTPVATARLSACAAACSLSTHPLTNESHLQRVCKKMAPLNGFEKKWFKKNSAVFLFRYLLLL